MSDPPGGLHAFLRAYFHVKSADASRTTSAPHRLPSVSASSLAVLPNYYIMPLHATMPQAVAPDAPSSSQDPPGWLTDAELDEYVAGYTRTGFKGGLNLYRCLTDPTSLTELEALKVSSDGTTNTNTSTAPALTLTVPTMFIAGKQDWGVYQLPGAVERMKDIICARTMAPEDFVLVDGAGHWVQQEAPEVVMEHLLRFLRKVADARLES